MRTRSWLVWTLAALLTATTVPVAAAPDKVFDARGFVAEREFQSQLPFEHVDPMTGNLLLTFTDLVLPGNAGFDLRIQRTYNSKIYQNYSNFGVVNGFVEDSWAGLGWTLHFGRLTQSYAAPLQTLGPLIEMPDGSKHQSYRHPDPAADHYITKEYWTYDDRSPDPVLRLPNGVTYTFGRLLSGSGPNDIIRYVTRIADTFGNQVTINYAPAPAPADVIASVVQTVGVNQTRTVTFEYDPTLDRNGSADAAGSLKSMTFENRTWTYRQKHTNFVAYTYLEEVVPPLGPSWRFGYDEVSTQVSPAMLKRVTTPAGAVIEYDYAAQLFQVGSGVISTPSLRNRIVSGPGMVTGTWQYQYLSLDWREPVQSTVISPCGTTTRYTFKAIGPSGAEEPWAIGALRIKEISDETGLLERETLQWVRSVPISDVPESGNSFATHVPLLGSRLIERPGSSENWTTTYLYDGTAYSAARSRNFNDYGRPAVVIESGELARATLLAYAYPSGGDPGFTNYIVDRLGVEVIGGQTQLGTNENFTRAYSYDTRGFRTGENIHGIVRTFTPDALGNVATVRDADDKLTRYEYQWGVVKNVITPEYTISRAINSDGTIESETRRGFTTRYEYDLLGRVKLVDPPVGLNVATEYDNVNARFSIVRRGVSEATTRFNGVGQTVETVNKVRVMTRRGYDACGRPVYQSHPFTAPNSTGSSTPESGITTTYDGLGRVTRRVHSGNANGEVTYQHEANDVVITDENGHQTRQDWLGFGSPDGGLLVAVTDAEGQSTGYAYNLLGRLNLVVGPTDGGVGSVAARAWVYNARNELAADSQPESGLTQYTYYPNGNLRTRQDAQFGVTTFTYDGNNRLTGVDRPGVGYDTTIGYDASDNRTSLVNGLVNTTFGYDGVNRLLSRVDRMNGRIFTTSYAYEDLTAWNGNLRWLTYPTGRTIGYEYDEENRITKVTGAGRTLASQFDYHASGAVKSFGSGNGLTQSFQYDERHRLERITSAPLNLRYRYDAVGNVERIEDSRPGFDQAFGYDDLDRVTSASGPWGAASFGYDSQGNRRNKTIAGVTTNYAYNSATNRLDSATGAEASSFAYDSNGNLTQDARGTYQYGSTNLMAIATVAGQASAYAYDGDDQRKIRVSGGRTHYYLHGPGNQILSEILDKGTDLEHVRDYVYAGSRLIAAIRPPALAVSPASLQFAALAGGARSPNQRLRVTSKGGGLSYTATASTAWIRLSSSSGSTPSTLLVSVDPASLPAGAHTGTVTITSPGAQDSPRVVTISATVVSDPELQASPQALYFEAKASGGTASAGQETSVTAQAAPPARAGGYAGLPLSFDENRGQTHASVRFLARGPGYGLYLSPSEVLMGLAAKDRGGLHRVRMSFEGGNANPEVAGDEALPGRSHYYRGSDRKNWVTEVPQFGRVRYNAVYPGVDMVFYGNQGELEYDLLLAPRADLEQVKLRFSGADDVRLADNGDLVLALEDGELRQRKPLVYQDVEGVRREVPARYRRNDDGTIGFEVPVYDRDRALVLDPVLSYFTYLGGSLSEGLPNQGVDFINGMAVGSDGSVYVTGMTTSVDFPMTVPDDWAGQETLLGTGDAFVAKLGPGGSSLVYSTFFGGTGRDRGYGIALSSGAAFVLGGTSSADFPTTEDAFQSTFAGPNDPNHPNPDLFVAQVGSSGQLLFSSYLGGSNYDHPAGIGAAGGAAYVAGWTNSTDLPVRNAHQPSPSPLGDAFAARIVPSGSSTVPSLEWLTYLGGSGGDSARGVAVSSGGSLYVTGGTSSPDFPMVAPYQSQLNRGLAGPGDPPSDAFLVRFDASGDITYSTYLGGGNHDWGVALALGTGNTAFLVGGTLSPDFPLRNPMQPILSGSGSTPSDTFAVKLDLDSNELVYSTFLGATGFSAAAADAEGHLMLLGSTEAPLVNAFRPAGGSVLAKLDADGSRYLFSSSIGTGLLANAVALSATGDVYLAGETRQPNQATALAVQPDLRGYVDGFIMKFTGTGGGAGGPTVLQQEILIKDKLLPNGPGWTASESTPWLEISPHSGTGPSVVVATVDTTGLAPGTYTGAITVSAAGALSSPSQVDITLEVKSGQPQPVQVVPGGPYFSLLGQEIQFDGSASTDPAGTIKLYEWNFGDGTVAQGLRPKHTFTTPGNHPVSLTVTGYSGESATAQADAYVNFPPVPILGLPPTGVTGQVLSFDAGASVDPDGTITDYRWDFGDGALGVGPIFVHAYTQPGVYTVSLLVTDDDLDVRQATATVTITLGNNEPPVARVGGPYARRPGENVSLRGDQSSDPDGNIVSWQWDLGDGNTGNGANFTTQYANPGVYTVTLTVTDGLGATGTATTQVHVGDFEVSPSSLAFRGFSGGDDPPTQALTLSFPSPLAWEASEGEAWLAVDVATGTTPANVVVSAETSDLTAGTRRGTVTLRPVGVEYSPSLVLRVPVEFVVEPPIGTCATEAIFCEPFDQMALGELAGQNGWSAAPTATALSTVALDPRGDPGAKILTLDPPDGTISTESHVLPELPLEDLVLTFGVMSQDVPPGFMTGRLEILSPLGATIGSVWMGSNLLYRNGEQTLETLLNDLEGGRWYSVRLVFQGSEVEGFVDGDSKFRVSIGAVASDVGGLSIVGGSGDGSVNLDHIQLSPFEELPTVGELVVEPASIAFYRYGGGQQGSAHPTLGPRQDPPPEVRRDATGAPPVRAVGAPPTSRPLALSSVRRTAPPLSFEPTPGPPLRAGFVARSRGYSVGITPAETRVALAGPRTAELSLRFDGARSGVELVGLDPQPGRSHYLLGRDPSLWRRDVPHFGRVGMKGLYPGIDAVFYGRDGNLEYDLVVAPGADPSPVRVRFEGVNGLRLDSNGDLILQAAGGEVRHQRPVVYQTIGGEQRPVAAAYRLLDARTVAFDLADYDRSASLTIDPTLVYSTYLGGAANDAAHAVAVDLTGHAYVAGTTGSPDFPVAEPFGAFIRGTTDAFVSKFSPDGSQLVYSTYLGGLGPDGANAIAVDAEGNVFLAGKTESPDFPSVNASQTVCDEGSFLLKLGAGGGDLVYSTCFGSGSATINAMALGRTGHLSVAGTVGLTASSAGGVPTLSAHLYSPPSGAQQAAFVARFDQDGRPVFSTYLGGGAPPGDPPANNHAAGVTVDAMGNTLVTGYTTSAGFQVTIGAFQPARGGTGTNSDAFLVRFGPNGSLQYATYLGGSSGDLGKAIAVDDAGSAYITGSTSSTDFPTTPDPFQSFHGGQPPNGQPDGFLTKFSPDGAGLVYSSFLGEPRWTAGQAVAVDAGGSAVVAGTTQLADPPNDTQAFVARVNAEGSALVSPGTLRLGGSAVDELRALSIDGAGNVHAAGATSSPDFATLDGLQANLGGGTDAFVVRLFEEPPPPSGILHVAPGYWSREDGGAAQITVGRIGGSLGSATVEYATSDGTATLPWDYTQVSGTLAFADGETTKTFSVPLGHNQVYLGDKAFGVSLSNPIGAPLGRAASDVTIIEADAAPASGVATFRVRDLVLPTGPEWTAEVDVSWLILSAYSGTGPTVVTVTADLSQLGSGTHMGQITITAAAEGSPKVIPVTAEILCTEGCGSAPPSPPALAPQTGGSR